MTEYLNSTTALLKNDKNRNSTSFQLM